MAKQSQLLEMLQRIGAGASGGTSSRALRTGASVASGTKKFARQVATSNVGQLLATLDVGDAFGEAEIVRDFMALPHHASLRKRRATLTAQVSSIMQRKDGEEDDGRVNYFIDGKGPGRNHIVKAGTDVELLVMSAEQFVEQLIQTDTVQTLCFAPVTARKCLAKSAEHRNELEVVWLQQFVRGHPFLSQLPNHLLQDVCKVMRYRQYPASSCVVEQGTPVNDVDAFFIILSGNFYVHRHTSTHEVKRRRAAAANTSNDDGQRLGGGAGGGDNTQDLGDAELAAMDASRRRVLFGDHVVTLCAGDSFGHDALSSSNNERGASVIAGQQAEVLVLSRDEYACRRRFAQLHAPRD